MSYAVDSVKRLRADIDSVKRLRAIARETKLVAEGKRMLIPHSAASQDRFIAALKSGEARIEIIWPEGES